MKKLIIVIALLTLSIVSNVQAQNWIDYENKTKVGAVYAVICNVCNERGRYNDDIGVWHCSNDGVMQSPAYRDCKQAIITALLGRYEG